MHYKNGRPAKLGDQVISKAYDGTPFSGVVIGLREGSTTCNLVVVPLPAATHHLNASDTMLASDVECRPYEAESGK